MANAPVPPFYAATRSEGALIAVLGIAAYILFAHLFGEGRGTVAAGAVTAFGLALRIGWPLRKQLWFWVTLLALAALHTIALGWFAWSAAADWWAATYIPFMIADVALILMAVYLIYRWRYGVPAELVGDPNPRYADERNYPLD